jgi:hypothetical protein
MLGAARRAHVRRTVHRRGQRRRSYKLHIGGIEDRSRRSYRLHNGGSDGGLETSRGGAGGGLEPADIEGARSRSHGPAAELPELGLGEPESTHRWTGTTCRAAPLACSDWSKERDVGRSRLDPVEGGGENGKPGLTGCHPRFLRQAMYEFRQAMRLDTTPVLRTNNHPNSSS